MRPLRSLTHKSAHGHTWGLLPACSPKGEEHIRKLLCRNRLRGLSWKGTSQSRLFATASKQPACPQSGHEPTLYVIRQQSLTWSGSSCTHPFVQRPLLYGVTGLLATPRLGNASTDPLRSVYTILLIEQAHLLVCFPPARAKLPQVTARLLVPGSTWRVRSPVGRLAHHRAGALLPLMP